MGVRESVVARGAVHRHGRERRVVEGVTGDHDRVYVVYALALELHVQPVVVVGVVACRRCALAALAQEMALRPVNRRASDGIHRVVPYIGRLVQLETGLAHVEHGRIAPLLHHLVVLGVLGIAAGFEL